MRLLLSTNSFNPYQWGGWSDLSACSPPASHDLTSSVLTPSESVHKSRDKNELCMWVQLKRCYVGGCYKGDILVMDVSCCNLCVTMIEKV